MSKISQEEFDAALDLIDVRKQSPDDTLRIVAERFPGITWNVFRPLLVNYLALQEARQAEVNRQIKVATAVINALPGEPRSSRIGEAAKRRAAAGEPAAKALLAELNSPDFRYRSALLQAAVAAHPDWHSLGDDGSFTHRPPPGTPRADPVEGPDKLVQWFVDEYPERAAALAESFGIKIGTVP